MKTVIMAGGRGSRIAALAGDMPKPMLPIAGKPVLEHELACLRDQGFTDILLVVGYRGQAIIDYFGDGSGISPATGRPFGVQIEYCVEETPLGTAGALFRLRDRLTEDFFLLNADALFDVDFRRFADFHFRQGGLATLFTHPNSHPYDSGLIVADAHYAVEQWLSKEEPRPQYYRNRVNAGLHILSPELLKTAPDTPKVDLDRQLLKPLAGTGRLFAYDSPEYVKDMGTPERYEAVCRDFRAGIPQKKNLLRKQRAVFLDRDGVINPHIGFLRNIEDFELLPGAAEAIARFNAAGCPVIVVTNQPVIARGEVTVAQLQEIHNKMETLLGRAGAYVDAIYYCPHHPDRGFPGEIAELKCECDCRKPKPGMLIQAAKDFHIDLNASWMIGDQENDVAAGLAAGCRTVLIAGAAADYGQEMTCRSLFEVADRIADEI